MNDAPPTHPARPPRLRPPVLVAAAVLIVVGALAWRLWPHPAARASPDPPAHAFQPTAQQLKSLGLTPVATRSFRSVVRSEGTVAFNDEATTPVYSPFTGQVIKVTARLGDRVRRGQALFVVSAGEFAQGRSDVATARAAFDTAQATERRQRELFDAGAAAQRDWLQAQSDRIAAEAAWSAARGRLRILGKRDAEIDALEHTPSGGPETPVGAPIAGIVTQRAVAEGQYIQSASAGSSPPLFVIADLSRLWVLGYVRESDAPAIRAGQPAEIRVAAIPHRAFAGRVEWAAAELDPTNHRLAVRVVVENAGDDLKPQMYADVTIATSPPTVAPAVPESAIVYDGEVARVFVESGGTIRGREVRLGRHADGYVEVLGGLQPGEKIVTSATLFVDHTPAGD